MFARRSLQRALDRLVTDLTPEQLSNLEGRLRGPTTREQIAAEWETIILAAVSGNSRLKHENNCGGSSRPDIHATIADLDVEFVADIRSVSDADMEDDNPIERLREEVFRAALDFGMNGAGLFLYAESLTARDKKQRQILAVPHRAAISDFVSEHVRPFLRLVAETRTEDREFRHDAGDVRLRLEYRSSETNFSGGSWQTYTWARTPTHNPVYRALEEKSDQLRKSGFKGPKGVFICDGGCEALGKNLDEIVDVFFRQHKNTVSFIAALDLPEARGVAAVRPFLRHHPRMRVLWNPHHSAIPSERLGEALERVVRAIPPGVTPSQYARHQHPDPDLRYHNSFEGAFSVDRSPEGYTQVRISARAALQVLSGDLRHRPGAGYSVPVELFQAQLAAGRTIRSVRIERLQDDDDDWLVIELGEDPALVPLLALPGDKP